MRTLTNRKVWFPKTLSMFILLVAAPYVNKAVAQNAAYQVGMRSMIINGTMPLSTIDPVFEDLSADGLKGAHASSIFILWSVRPHLRLGLEAVFGNADDRAQTTMDFQGSGLVVEGHWGRRVIIAGGLHVGGLIASAQHTPTPDDKATSGTFYKGTAFFVAPHLSVGTSWGRYELRLLTKWLTIGEVPDYQHMDAFRSTYTGISIAQNF